MPKRNQKSPTSDTQKRPIKENMFFKRDLLLWARYAKEKPKDSYIKYTKETYKRDYVLQKRPIL